MTLEERIAELEEEVAYLRSELGLTHSAGREANFRKSLGITAQESRFLMALYDARGRMLLKTQLEDAIKRGFDGKAQKVVDVYACRVRKRIGFDAIETVWGSGYRITPKGIAIVEAIEPKERAAA